MTVKKSNVNGPGQLFSNVNAPWCAASRRSTVPGDGEPANGPLIEGSYTLSIIKIRGRQIGCVRPGVQPYGISEHRSLHWMTNAIFLGEPMAKVRRCVVNGFPGIHPAIIGITPAISPCPYPRSGGCAKCLRLYFIPFIRRSWTKEKI